MKTIPIFVINAFTTTLFSGNPAAVCPLSHWLDDDLMQAIAKENGFPETAFFVPLHDENNSFHLRWFTPDHEMDLCGHGTLATAYVIFKHLSYTKPIIHFQSLSGLLSVQKVDKDSLMLDFPARIATPCDPIPYLAQTLNLTIIESLNFQDKHLIICDDAQTLKMLKPDFQALDKLGINILMISAKDKSKNYDFISRYFKPNSTIKEDPVTGSAHCILTPYWAKQSGKSIFHAYQASPRGGEIICELSGNRVLLKGKATEYLQGTIQLPL